MATAALPCAQRCEQVWAQRHGQAWAQRRRKSCEREQERAEGRAVAAERALEEAKGA